MTFGGMTVTTATDQTVSCIVTGLSLDTPITWIDPDNIKITNSDSNGYIVDQGEFISGGKTSTLTIKAAKFASLSSGNLFKCSLKSSLYPAHSPAVAMARSIILLTLGKPRFVL